jgi:hypothetical protein
MQASRVSMRARQRTVRCLIACSLFTLILWPQWAQAWCRTTTESLTFIPTPTKPCDDQGKPIYWSSKCVGYSVQRDASVQLDLEKARILVQRAFDEWSKVSCPADLYKCDGVAKGSPSISGVDLGVVGCDCVEYNKDAANANIVIFRDKGWMDCYRQPLEGAEETLALTTVTYSKDSGEIYDADIEINSNPDVNPLRQRTLRPMWSMTFNPYSRTKLAIF